MTKKELHWYAVGEQDSECGWKAIQAVSDDDAVAQYRQENDTEAHREVDAVFIKNWQGKDEIALEDWFYSGEGLTYGCSCCGEPANEAFGGAVIDGDIYCEFCLEDRQSPEVNGNG
ncbi:hypothetical protein [Hoeflea sp. TYP-13]|uniref:hypothetical protein n=1 Tax=Hoeflea sp. TYP-13 TaxID=3230023 RepID=UPI0034C63753